MQTSPLVTKFIHLGVTSTRKVNLPTFIDILNTKEIDKKAFLVIVEVFYAQVFKKLYTTL